MNCFQKNRGTKHYLDIDFDIDKDDFFLVEYLASELKKNGVRYYIISTKGGYHVLVDRHTLNYNFNDIIRNVNVMAMNKYGDDRAFEIIHNKNEMVPLPGTFQGGYPVTLVKGA